MNGRSFDWLDSRTSYRKLLAPIRRRILPGGPSWTRTTGSCLLWLLLVEVVTGLLLMFTYSPSASSAWASVHYIESIPGGDFIRGLHYFTSQALLIALALHTIRTLVAGAFRAPRELIWATGLLLISDRFSPGPSPETLCPVARKVTRRSKSKVKLSVHPPS